MSSSRAPNTNYPSLRTRAASAPPRQSSAFTAYPKSQNNALSEVPQSNAASELKQSTQFESEFLVAPALRPDEAPTPRGTIVVYTDASCKGNYASGAGIYFGEGHELNLSQPLPGPIHSSIFAELQAATIALERLRGWSGYRGQLVLLRSDCKSIVDSLRSGHFNDPRYTEQLIKLRMAAESFPSGVQFEHIYGHNGHPGNEMADRLAGQATENCGRGRSMSVNRRRSRSRSASRNGRGAPNATVFVPPKTVTASLAMSSADQSLCNSTNCQDSKLDASQSEVSRGRSRSIKTGKSQTESTNLRTQSHGKNSCASSQVSSHNQSHGTNSCASSQVSSHNQSSTPRPISRNQSCATNSCATSQVVSHNQSCASKPVSLNQSQLTRSRSEVPKSQAVNARMQGPTVSKSLPSQSKSASTSQSMSRGASTSQSMSRGASIQ